MSHILKVCSGIFYREAIFFIESWREALKNGVHLKLSQGKKRNLQIVKLVCKKRVARNRMTWITELSYRIKST